MRLPTKNAIGPIDTAPLLQTCRRGHWTLVGVCAAIAFTLVNPLFVGSLIGAFVVLTRLVFGARLPAGPSLMERARSITHQCDLRGGPPWRPTRRDRRPVQR